VDAVRKLLQTGNQYKMQKNVEMCLKCFHAAGKMLHRALEILQKKDETVRVAPFYMLHCVRGILFLLDELHESQMRDKYRILLDKYLLSIGQLA
jgi:hypothetical protein